MPDLALKVELTFDEGEFTYLVQNASQAGMSVPAWIKSRLGQTPDAAKLATINIVPAEPSGESAIKTKRKYKKRGTVESPHEPVGFDAIVRLANKLVAARKQAVKASGSTKGIKYNRAITQWYADNNYANIASSVRAALGQVATHLDGIREWHRHLPDNYLPDHIGPGGLIYYYTKKAIPPATPKLVAPPTPKLRKAESLGVDKTIAYRDGRLRTVPISEVLHTNGSVVATIDEKAKLPAYESFNQVDFDNLITSDKRVLKLFARRLLTQEQGNISENLPARDIASVLRKIRGQETGDNPPSVQTLLRIGVLWGKSGDFKLRREFVARMPDVKQWALQWV
jgi:hypothetical protein